MRLDNKYWMLCINLITALRETGASSEVLLFNVSNANVKIFRASNEKQLSMTIPVVKSDNSDKTGIYMIRTDQINGYIAAVSGYINDLDFNMLESSFIFNNDGTMNIKTRFKGKDKKIKTITRKIYYILANLEHIQTRGVVIQANNMVNRINEYKKKSDVDIWGTDELSNIISLFDNGVKYKDIYMSSYSNAASSVYSGYALEIPLHKAINNNLIISKSVAESLNKALRFLSRYLREIEDTTDKESKNSSEDDLYDTGTFESEYDTEASKQGNQIELLKPFDTTDAILKTFDGTIAIQFKQSDSTVETTSIINNLTMGKIYEAYSIISKKHLVDEIKRVKGTDIIIRLSPNLSSKEKSAFIEVLNIDKSRHVGGKQIPTFHFYENSYRVFGYYIKIDLNTLKNILKFIESEYITFDIGVNKICIGDTDINVLKDIRDNRFPLQVSLIDRRSDIQIKRAYMTYSKVQ